jgi:anti-sigma factor (TIGR02949 family)
VIDRWRRRRILRRTGGIDCRHAVELVYDYLEGTLAAADVARLEQHLAACPPCVRYVDEVRASIEVIGRLDPEAVPADVRDDLVEVMRRFRSGS